MAGYHLLPSTKEHDHNDDETATPSSIGPAAAKSKLWKYISALASFLLICIITLVAFVPTNRQVLPNEAALAEDLSFLTPPGPITKTFTLDEVFRQRPSPESDEAWRSILPNGLGIVQHPSLGPEILSLAFVHQLHCLDMIRKTYFTAREDCSAASSENDKHTVHCLDYLRQALQCHADTNLEYRVVSGTGTGTGDAGFTGYSEHKCRDFERVFRFAEEWRVYEGKNESERVRVSEGEMEVGRVIDYDYVSSRGDGETMVG